MHMLWICSWFVVICCDLSWTIMQWKGLKKAASHVTKLVNRDCMLAFSKVASPLDSLNHHDWTHQWNPTTNDDTPPLHYSLLVGFNNQGWWCIDCPLWMLIDQCMIEQCMIEEIDWRNRNWNDWNWKDWRNSVSVSTGIPQGGVLLRVRHTPLVRARCTWRTGAFESLVKHL